MYSINSKNNISKVGLTIFSGLVILFLFIVIVGTGENLFSKTYNLNLIVRETTGLKKGGSVLLGGLKVGRIKNIRFLPHNNNNQIIIELSILKEYSEKITSGSNATIETFGLLGDKMINISLGNPNERPLIDGDFIKLEESFNLESLGSELNPIIKKIDNIATDIKQISTALSSGNSTIGKLLTEDSSINKLNYLLDELSTIFSSIKSSKGTVGKFINEPKLYYDLSATIYNLKTISDSLAIGKGTIGKFLTNDSFYNHLDSLTYNLNLLIKKTENDSSLVGGSLNDKTLYKKFNTLIEDLNSLIIDIKENPKRYINVSVF
ncbi:MAG: MlaD family protein [Bacteroidota bacterium]